MSVSRRKFLKAGAIAGACATLPLSAVEVLAGQQRGGRLPGSQFPDKKLLELPTDLTMERFAAQLHTPFRVQLGVSNAIELELIQVAEVRPTSRAVSLDTSRQESFSVIFRGPRETPLGQDTYHIEHSEMGKFDLFIVPGSEGGDGKHYEAAFNRLRPYNLHRLMELRRFR